MGLDVGASLGVYTSAFSRWCQRTIAVEPNPEMAEHLRRLALPRTEVLEAAAAAQAGAGVLVDAEQSGWRRPEARLGAQGGWSQACRLMRLDDSLSDPEALVCKIDVEGGELGAMQGMPRLLQCEHLLLVVEVEHRHNQSPSAVFDLLAEAGLSPFLLSAGHLIPTDPGQFIANQTGRPGRFARLSGYRPNVIFARPESFNT